MRSAKSQVLARLFSTPPCPSLPPLMLARSMSDGLRDPPRNGVTVTPPRGARIAPIDPDTPESTPPNPNSVGNNARQQTHGANAAASSEATPPKRDEEEEGEHHDMRVSDGNYTADTPVNDVATVARMAGNDSSTWADEDCRDEVITEADETMAGSGDEFDDVPVWRDAEAAPDETQIVETVDEAVDVDETLEDDTAEDRPERWAFLDLRGGHHALDLYHEVSVVAFSGVCPSFFHELTRSNSYTSTTLQSGGLDGSSYSDTTSAQASRGRDIQGIPWDRLQFTRERYREKRVAEYKNYANVDFDHSILDRICTPVEEVGGSSDSSLDSSLDTFYTFAHNTRAVRSNFVHFQLRNLVWSTSKNDAYVMSENKIVHWNSATRRATTTLDLDGGGGGDTGDNTNAEHNGTTTNDQYDDDIDGASPSGSGRGSTENDSPPSFALSGNFPRIQVSTTCARDSLIAAGGFAGELVVLDVDTGVSVSTRVTQDDNGITNAVDFFSTPSGAEALVCSNNDKLTRWYDIASMKCVGKHMYPWAVNYTAVGADGKLSCVVGDTKDAWVVDTQTGKLVAKCSGHLDFSFAAAWHPDGLRFATGNQDTTTRVWDIRHLGQSLAVLRGKMGAVRSLRFSSDGNFLVSAEPADFTHVYDVSSNFTKRQTLDHFGETAGVSFSPCGESLFIGVADLTYGSVLEFERKRWGSVGSGLIA